MRILCQVGRERDRAIYDGWRRVFEAAGHTFTLWEPGKPAFDAFDESAPNLFVETSPRSRGVQRCLDERLVPVVDRRDPQPAFDMFLFDRPDSPQYGGSLNCDLAYVGNYRSDKADLLERYVMPLAERFRLKVFGREPWPLNEYLGPVREETLPCIYRSARVCLNVSGQPRFPERVYQILGVGGVCLSSPTPCPGLSVLPVAMAEPDGFHDEVRDLLEDERRRRAMSEQGVRMVLGHHTYFHRVAEMLAEVGMFREAEQVMGAYNAAVRV